MKKRHRNKIRCLLIILSIINFNYFLVISIVNEFESEPTVASIVNFPWVSLLKIKIYFALSSVGSIVV